MKTPLTEMLNRQRRQAEPPPDFTGRLNRYTCQRCGARITTIDREPGVTPMFVTCMITPGCEYEGRPAVMVSSMYNGVEGTPQFEWRKPTATELAAAPPSVRQHVQMGGLLLYRIAGADLEPCKPGRDADDVHFPSLNRISGDLIISGRDDSTPGWREFDAREAGFTPEAETPSAPLATHQRAGKRQRLDEFLEERAAAEPTSGPRTLIATADKTITGPSGVELRKGKSGGLERVKSKSEIRAERKREKRARQKINWPN